MIIIMENGVRYIDKNGDFVFAGKLSDIPKDMYDAMPPIERRHVLEKLTAVSDIGDGKG